MKRLILSLFTLVVTAFGTIVDAQSICTALMQQAISLVGETCATTGRNQACHGYLRVDAQPRPAVDDFDFELGDVANLTDVQSLTSAPLDAAMGEWGVALLRVQANLPDTLPGENATFLLFGDTQLEDTATSDDANPMQAFRLQTGISGTRCESAPQDGLLIQTPHGVGRVELSINGVSVSLGSTVFFEAQAGGNLVITTLEGSARVTLNGRTQTALPGESIRVPMDIQLRPAGNVGAPLPYNVAEVAKLPVQILDRAVTIVSNTSVVEVVATPLPVLATAVAPVVDTVTDVVSDVPIVGDVVDGDDDSSDDCTDNSCNGGGGGSVVADVVDIVQTVTAPILGPLFR